MLFDAAAALPHLRRALEVSRDPAVHVWTNRLDPNLLEGYESLIQDPHKLHDEIRGRRDILGDLVAGRPMRCAGDRCSHCFIRPLCEAMAEAVASLSDGVPGILLADGPDPAGLVGLGRQVLWIRATDASAVQQATGAKADRLWLELDELRGTRNALAQAGLEQPLRIVLRSARQLRDAARIGPDEVALPIQPEARAISTGLGCRTFAFVPPVLTLRQAAAQRGAGRDRSPGFDGWIGEPPCLADGKPPRYADPMPLSALDGRGRLDPDAFVDHFVRHLYRIKSLRCRACVHDAACRGLPIQRARLEGLARLVPIEGA